MLEVGVVVALSLFLGVESWVNDYDKPFTFTCPSHQSINRVVSHHDNGAEDRKFDFQCTKYTEGTESCFWSEYANNFDQPVAFQCPNGGVMDGVSSYHDNGAEDRRFRFYCCEKPGMCLYNCFYSGWVNSYDGYFDYAVPPGHVMRGWTSIHDNGAEDRIFNFEVCLMKICINTGLVGELIGKRAAKSTNGRHN